MNTKLINILRDKNRLPCDYGVCERYEGYLFEEGIVQLDHLKFKLKRLGPDRVYTTQSNRQQVSEIYRDFEYELINDNKRKSNR